MEGKESSILNMDIAAVTRLVLHNKRLRLTMHHKPCKTPGCPNRAIIDDDYCPEHMRPDQLTDTQQAYYNAIVEHIGHFHSFPTMSELGAMLGGYTANASYEMVQRLVRKGVVDEWAKGKFRLARVVFEPRAAKRNEELRTPNG